jgi:hypothetical protein
MPAPIVPVLTDARGELFTESQLQRLHQGAINKIWCGYWRRRPSLLRPGEPALRRELLPSTNHTGPRSVFAYVHSDVQDILAGKESEVPSVGRGARTALRRKSLHAKACQVMRGILHDGPVSSDEVLKLAAAQGVKRTVAYKVKGKLKIKAFPSTDGSFHLWCLPRQEPPAVQSQVGRATELLSGWLQNGPLRVTEIRQRGEEAGLLPYHLELSKRELDVRAEASREGYYWCLPGQHPPEVSQPPNAQAAAFLRARLAGKEALQKEVVAEGARWDYGYDTLIRTLKAIGGKSRRESRSRTAPYLWSMPGMAPQPQVADNTDGGGNPTGGTSPTAESAEYPGHTRKPYRTGRRPNWETEQVLKFCYDQYITEGRSRAQVLTRARERFGVEAPADEREVARNAQRWSQRFTPPLAMVRPK